MKTELTITCYDNDSKEDIEAALYASEMLGILRELSWNTRKKLEYFNAGNDLMFKEEQIEFVMSIINEEIDGKIEQLL